MKTKLAQRRVGKRVSQQELAERTGISARTLQRIERGQVDNPPLRYLVNAAMALDCELMDVVEDEWLEWKVFDTQVPRPRHSRLGNG